MYACLMDRQGIILLHTNIQGDAWGLFSRDMAMTVCFGQNPKAGPDKQGIQKLPCLGGRKGSVQYSRVRHDTQEFVLVLAGACWNLTAGRNFDTLSPMTIARNRMYLLLGPLLGMVALIVYSITLSRGPFPGESADLMVRELGLAPLMIGQNPLWSWLIDLVELLPLGSVAFRLNFLSAIFGAGSVWMLFRITADALWLAIPVTDLNVRAANRASILGGVVAALALMGCMPFWYAATRFHMALFDLVLLFVLARLFLRFIHDAAVWVGLLLAFLYGVFAVEFATLILFGPLVWPGCFTGCGSMVICAGSG